MGHRSAHLEPWPMDDCFVVTANDCCGLLVILLVYRGVTESLNCGF